ESEQEGAGREERPQTTEPTRLPGRAFSPDELHYFTPSRFGASRTRWLSQRSRPGLLRAGAPPAAAVTATLSAGRRGPALKPPGSIDPAARRVAPSYWR